MALYRLIDAVVYIPVAVQAEVLHHLRHPFAYTEQHVLVNRPPRHGEGIAVERVVGHAHHLLVEGQVRIRHAAAPDVVLHALRIHPDAAVLQGQTLQLRQLIVRRPLTGQARALYLHVVAELGDVLHHAALAVEPGRHVQVALKVKLYHVGSRAGAGFNYAQRVELLQGHAHGEAVRPRWAGGLPPSTRLSLSVTAAPRTPVPTRISS